MVWKKSDGTIIYSGKSWVDDNNIRHPTNWNIWTDTQKKSKGLTWEDDPVIERFDNRFYDAKDIEKKLADVNVVDADGKAIIDVRTGKQMVSLGLKSNWVAKTKQTANNLLAKSDWEITRKAEKGTAIASATSTFRDAVRTACDTIETKINNCSDLNAFKALFDAPVDSDGKVTGNPPIHDFPSET
tara:strand:+ start:2471 stop:3028 length:558 start_codon:yes stop_codon:yes gene_type:complete